jgi:hypothetical protein
MGHTKAPLVVRNPVFSKAEVSTITTASAVAFTGAQLLGGLILRDPNGAGRADTVPTVALLVAAMKALGVSEIVAGDSFEFTIRNTADAAETITVTTATGWTLSGTMTIAQNNSKRFKVVFASEAAATLYSLGTVVH